MIVGIGTDIVRIPRIRKVFEGYPQEFPRKILGDQELEFFSKISLKEKQISFLAKRFSAKEAFVKALGTGFRNGVVLPDIIVENDSLGKPQIRLLGKVNEFLPKGCDVFLSIADEIDMAVSFVVIQRSE